MCAFNRPATAAGAGVAEDNATSSSKLKRQGTITSIDDNAEVAAEAATAAAAAGAGEPVDETEDALPADILTHQST